MRCIFIGSHCPLCSTLKAHLKSDGRFVIVEYNVDQGNCAVPFPISFERWSDLADAAGFTQTRLLSTRPSRFLKEIYSALSA